MSSPSARLDRSLVDASYAFLGRQLWQRHAVAQFVALRIPLYPDPVLATVTGATGSEFGVTCFLGPTAADDVERVLGSEPPGGIQPAELIAFTMSPLADIPAECRDILVRAGHTARRTELTPFIYGKRAFGCTHHLNRTETRGLLFVLRAILLADAAGHLETRPVRTGARLQLIIVSGEATDPQVAFDEWTYAPSFTLPRAARQASEPADEEQELESFDWNTVPAPNDLAGWKRADRAACGEIARRVAAAGLLTPSHVAKFLDDDDLVDEFFGRSVDETTAQAVMEWLFVSRRTSKRTPTVLERALTEDLPPALRTLFIARRDGHTCLYRVDEVRPGKSVALVDVRTGTRRVVHDIALSHCASEGYIFPARVYAVGEFNFVTMLGPVFVGLRADAAISYLTESGAGRDLGRLEAKPHLCGHLFILERDMRTWAPATPQVLNADRDPVLFHNATYQAANEGAVRAAFAARPDFIHDEEDDSFTWVEANAAGGTAAFQTPLGSMQIVGDELLVQTNSAERAERFRKVLEAIPGVRLLTTRTKTIEDLRASPVDDRLRSDPPPEFPPELVGQLAAHFEDLCMRWLDESVPALGGRTPREACRTADGRAKVRLMIETMPPPAGNAGRLMRPPRERLLRELGLDREA